MMTCSESVMSRGPEVNINSILSRSSSDRKSTKPLISSPLAIRPNAPQKASIVHASYTTTSTASDKPSKPSRSSKSSKRSKRTDDWAEITEPEERRRIQNRIAQRKFREKAREHKENLEREAQNQEHAGNAYRIPTAADFDDGDTNELSGLPWGCLSMTHIVSKGKAADDSRQFKDTSSYETYPKPYSLPYSMPYNMKESASPYSSTASTRTSSMISGTWSALFDHDASCEHDQNDMLFDYDMDQPSYASSTWLPLEDKHVVGSPDSGDGAFSELATDTTLPIPDLLMEDPTSESNNQEPQGENTDLSMALMTLKEEPIEHDHVLSTASRESTVQPTPAPTITLTSPSRQNSPEIQTPIDTGISPTSPQSPFNSTIQVSVERAESESCSTGSETLDESESQSTTPSHDMERATQLDTHRERAVSEMIDRVMDEFWTLFDQEWDIASVDSPGGSGPGNTSSSGTGISQRTTSDSRGSRNSRRRGPLKRRREDGNESADDQDDEPPNSAEPKPEDEESAAKKLACPYRKHDPFTYSIHNHKICALSPWPTIARLKEHLYRSHKVPPHCKRCWESFSTQPELDAHLMVPAASICETKPGHSPEGISPEQIVQLRSRKKTSRTQTDEDRWREIYRLLFPSQKDPPPSPYFEPVEDHSCGGLSPDSRDLLEYETFLRREIPRLVRSSLEQQARVEIQPLEQALVESLPRIIQECQESAFTAYRRRIRGSSRTTEAGQSETSEPGLSSSASLGSESQSSSVGDASLGGPQGRQGGPNGVIIAEDAMVPGIVEVAYRLPPSQEEDIMGLSLAQFEKPGRGEASDSGYGSTLGCQCQGQCVCWWDTLFDQSLSSMPQ